MYCMDKNSARYAYPQCQDHKTPKDNYGVGEPGP